MYMEKNKSKNKDKDKDYVPLLEFFPNTTVQGIWSNKGDEQLR